VSTCSFRAPPALWRRVAPLVARRRARRRSLCAYQAAVSTAAQLCPRHSCERRTANVGPSLPRQARFGQRRASRSPTTATRRTWCARRGLPRPHRCIPDPAQCGQHGCRGRGHRTPVCPDTRIAPVAWTPVAWTPDVRPTTWLDGRPHGGQRTRIERRTAWPTSGHPGRPRRRRPPAGRRNPRSG
jgi:hypothetical protein